MIAYLSVSFLIACVVALFTETATMARRRGEGR